MEITELLVIPVDKESSKDYYHSYDCCEWTRGIDTLMSRYKEDREKVVSMIKNSPDELIKNVWKPGGALAIDNKCMCRMGKGEERSPFSCAQCKNLRRLIDFRLGGVETPFQIECGEMVGKSLIVASSEINTPFIKWDDESARKARIFVQQYHNLTICGTPNINNSRCITGDSFTIRSLILWMIHDLFLENGLPHIPTMHTAFICRGMGYSLYDMPTIGTLSSLKKLKKLKASVVRTIITQLLVILLELSKVNFSHGTPSMHALIFNKEPVSYLYEEFHVEGEVTVQISDLWNASATFNNVHYFPKSVKSLIYLEKSMFVPEITTRKVSMSHCHDLEALDEGAPVVCPTTLTICPDSTTYSVCKPSSVTLYKLTNNTIDIYNAIRHIGFPLYPGSFDFYCFMVSLMCEKSFYDCVTNDNKLYRLWSMMWLLEDLPNIERSIQDYHQQEQKPENAANNRASANVAVNIVRGSWLRCDIVKYIWSLLKLGW